MRHIEWMGDWLKQIILLVLVATFLDMLLPSNAMEKYVKLVMGLLILMAILSPIFKLLSENLNLTELAFFDANKAVVAVPEMKSLADINEQTNQLKKQQDQVIQQKTKQSMETWMKKNIPDRFAMEVVSADVVAQFTTENPHIEKIHLVVREKAIDASAKQVKPVQEVSILPSNEPTPTESTSNETGKKIQSFIQQTWNLTAEQVEVQLE
ncbi:stage III sporulation protein AF [Thermoactinomyces sp. DSM 45892]|uniref:stage III sporulation protein AF n=1 Tax=Thermoactinomyces sp. DSM 45892 TaxID=1882753 RepID=UPI0008952951|nr:stage III sporulation protein AF [Thermoactinomyces sp. DSM 45892]SDX99674.1 stage III sporulation protein AF [Thermoactinomyces sp. DSM 45892]